MLQHPGSSWGFSSLLKSTSVVVLRVERELHIHSPHLQFLPDLRLKLTTFRLPVRLSDHRSRLPCRYKTVHCYIPVHTIVNLNIVIPYLLVHFLLLLSVFFVLSHHSAALWSFCHENKFLVCVNT